MIHFDMAISDNFARFSDDQSGLMVFVDSFDNQQFEVRVGSFAQSRALGTITASTDQELNSALTSLLAADFVAPL